MTKYIRIAVQNEKNDIFERHKITKNDIIKTHEMSYS